MDTADSATRDSGPFYHGTRADLAPGDLLEPGYSSNYGERKNANFIYLTATLDAATWGAELAVGAGPGRIYLVEPIGPIEDDPNLTDKRFPGNPTRSYRTRQPLRVVDEVLDWGATRAMCSRPCWITWRSSDGSASRQSTTEALRLAAT
jgi:rifampin ADP-ribosylating transferase